MVPYLKSAAIVSLSTLISRILGLVRDIALAVVFGASVVMDAFVLAFTIPNLFRQLFGEGALSAVFIPIFSETVEKNGKASGFRLASRVLTYLTIGLGCLVLLGIIVCVLCYYWPGMQTRNRLAFGFLAVMMPYLLLICLTAILGAILNARDHFLAPALSPALLNICWLIGIFGIAPLLGETHEMWAYGMAVAIVVGGICQLFMQWPPLVKDAGSELAVVWSGQNPELQRMLQNLWPVVISSAILELNVLLTRLIAWWMIPHEGSLTVLYMGNRLMQFPLAIIGISLSTVVFPLFTRHIARKEFAELAQAVPHAIRLTIFLSLPAAMGLIVLANPLVSLLYRYNRFNVDAAERTAWVLIAYALGLCSYSLLLILVKVFYAFEDTKTPMRVATGCVAINVFLSVILVPFLEEAGLALATTISGLFNLIVLQRCLRSKIALAWEGLGIFLLQTFLATAVMGIGVAIATSWYGPAVHFAGRLGKVAIPMGVGIFLYFGAAALCKIPESQYFRIKLLKRLRGGT